MRGPSRVGVKDLKIKDKEKDLSSKDKDEDFGFKDKHNDKIFSQTQRVAIYWMHAYKVP